MNTFNSDIIMYLAIFISLLTLIFSMALLYQLFHVKNKQQNLLTQVVLLADKNQNLVNRSEELSRTNSDLIKKVSQESYEKILKEHFNSNALQQRSLAELKEVIQQSLHNYRTQLDGRQLESLKMLQDSLSKGMSETRNEVKLSLQQHAEELSKRVEKLTKDTDGHLKGISEQVEKRLMDGFEKTTETFTNIVKRLALIDEAQKKITDLSTNVVSLQEILADKRSRGTFGEVQLSSLVRNMMPENSFALQHTLSNNTRADCVVFLPEPTGHVVIDSKFPLESYRRIHDAKLSDSDRRAAEQQFRKDIRKHIQDIATKYIIPNETADGAIMFVPAEAIFAEIYSHYADIVEFSYQSRVWLASPTTVMALLTTIRAVLKDEATRQQVHIIREHLNKLAKDFGRFSQRMDSLSTHIKQASTDVDEIHISAKKISSQFNRIEQADLRKMIDD
jgi:DNA recombination protein RmuC